MSTLIEAIKNKNLCQVKSILTKSPNAIDEIDENGTPMAFLAALTGSLDLVQYIVEYSRASMDITDKNERNILHYAAQIDNMELVKYLVERVGMDPLTGDIDLITPYEISHSHGNHKVEQYFESVIGCNFESMYQNPIRRGTFPDPSIVRVGEDYYMVNSSFTYFPCIPISHSKDLIHWHIIGHGITNPEYAGLEELESGRGYWAPDISYYEGRFYITATYRLNDDGTVYRRQIIISSDKPEGPYSVPVFIEEDGIDPSLFADEDGKRYMLLNRGARILELDKMASRQISEAKLLWYGNQKHAPEGPHLLKKDGFYYLFLAEGGTGIGHRISVGRSQNLMGPYESCPYNPIMRQTNSKGAIQRAGHGKPVMTQNGEWYMVYLCGRQLVEQYTILGRETALDPITWTNDGWPIVNSLKGPSCLQKKPKLPETKFPVSKNGFFQDEKLDMNWMWVKIPTNPAYEKQGDCIRLFGSKYPLYHRDARNILVQRQTNFIYNIKTYLEYKLFHNGQETGITCYYDENTYLTFGIEKKEDGFCLLVKEHIGVETRIPFSIKIPKVFAEKGITLRIDTNYLQKEFWYGFKDVADTFLGKLEDVNYLCDEGYNKGKRFTGAMAGIYTVSEEHKEIAWGDFSYFIID